MNSQIQQKVQQLKNSFSVEGVPLVKSNRFTEEEISNIKSSSTAHKSHWYRHRNGAKTWSDEEIAVQIEVFLNTPSMNESTFDKIVENIFRALPYENKSKEKKAFKDLLFNILGWTEEKNGISEMWPPFGSAPISGPLEGCRNKKLDEAARKYGAVDMNTIFDGQFSDKFHIFWFSARNAVESFDTVWEEARRKKDLKKEKFESPFKNLEDIEENVVVKKIPGVAKQYYMDKSKPFSDRIEVFTKYGKAQSHIFEPSDPDLKKIFDVYKERDWVERHQIVNTVDVVYAWISDLKGNRCYLNWTNRYHPKIDKEKRNYVPKQEAIDRLYRFYVEKLFLEEIGSFEYDW